MQIITDKNIIQRPIVATIGMFDGVHLGHRSLINDVKQEATTRNMASAIVTFSSHPRALLHPDKMMPLLNSFDERINQLNSTGIDYAIILDFTDELAKLTAREFIAYLHNKFNVQALSIGHDHRFGCNRTEGFDDYCRYGKELCVDIILSKPYNSQYGTISSSFIRKSLLASELEKANEMLGYSYTLSGSVIKGNQLGRKIGFPTANIQLNEPQKLIPASGAYAVRVKSTDGTAHLGMMNIGTRPTVSAENRTTIEVHIFDFIGDLYGQQLTIELVSFLRPEKQFSDIDMLQETLKLDCKTAKKILQ